MINKDEEIKMNVFSKVAVIAGLVGATTFAVANTTAVNQQALAPTQITTVKQALTLNAFTAFTT